MTTLVQMQYNKKTIHRRGVKHNAGSQSVFIPHQVGPMELTGAGDVDVAQMTQAVSQFLVLSPQICTDWCINVVYQVL